MKTLIERIKRKEFPFNKSNSMTIFRTALVEWTNNPQNSLEEYIGITDEEMTEILVGDCDFYSLVIRKTLSPKKLVASASEESC